MKMHWSLLLLTLSAPGLAATFTHEVQVPVLTSVNAGKEGFISSMAETSQTLYPDSRRSAIAPFGGVKLTPFLELDLQELVIVTNSYPGTPAEIERQFTSGRAELSQVLKEGLSAGAMSTGDVLKVTGGAQLLSRLKLELGVTEVSVRHSFFGEKAPDFSDRTMLPEDAAVATTFHFVFRGRPATLTLISSYILSDSAAPLIPGYPELLHAFIPEGGFNWAYLSADGLGHFSANQKNGLTLANQQLLGFLQKEGSVILDYPTDVAYHTTQSYGGIDFMNGRLDLEKMGLLRVKAYPLNRSGVFGYCTREGDEVRVYQKHSLYSPPTASKPLIQEQELHRWILK